MLCKAGSKSANGNHEREPERHTLAPCLDVHKHYPDDRATIKLDVGDMASLFVIRNLAAYATTQVTFSPGVRAPGATPFQLQSRSPGEYPITTTIDLAVGRAADHSARSCFPFLMHKLGIL